MKVSVTVVRREEERGSMAALVSKVLSVAAVAVLSWMSRSGVGARREAELSWRS